MPAAFQQPSVGEANHGFVYNPLMQGWYNVGVWKGKGWLKKEGEDCGSTIQNHGVDPSPGPRAVLRAFAFLHVGTPLTAVKEI